MLHCKSMQLHQRPKHAQPAGRCTYDKVAPRCTTAKSALAGRSRKRTPLRPQGVSCGEALAARRSNRRACRDRRRSAAARQAEKQRGDTSPCRPRRACAPARGLLVPDIGQAPGEPPEWSAMARTAVSQMSLQEVLGRGLLEIATVWSVTWVVRAVVKKFGDAAHKARAHQPCQGPRRPRVLGARGVHLAGCTPACCAVYCAARTALCAAPFQAARTAPARARAPACRRRSARAADGGPRARAAVRGRTGQATPAARAVRLGRLLDQRARALAAAAGFVRVERAHGRADAADLPGPQAGLRRHDCGAAHAHDACARPAPASCAANGPLVEQHMHMTRARGPPRPASGTANRPTSAAACRIRTLPTSPLRISRGLG